MGMNLSLLFPIKFKIKRPNFLPLAILFSINKQMVVVKEDLTSMQISKPTSTMPEVL